MYLTVESWTTTERLENRRDTYPGPGGHLETTFNADRHDNVLKTDAMEQAINPLATTETVSEH